MKDETQNPMYDREYWHYLTLPELNKLLVETVLIGGMHDEDRRWCIDLATEIKRRENARER